MTDSQRKHLNNNSEQGFTLVELVIVLLIGTILLLPLISLYVSYVKERNRVQTKLAIESAKNAIISYYLATGSYPCPSDLTQGMGTAGFGHDYCGTKNFATMAADVPLDTCLAGGGLCRVSGSRDEDGDGLLDPVLIGGIPFTTLADRAGIPMGVDKIAQDSWNGMLYYVVSQNLTYSAHPALDRFTNGLTNDYEYGVITALDEFNNPTAGINGNGQFAIFSAGPDQIAAFTIYGQRKNACDTTTTEGENCDADSTFKSALSDYDAQTASRYDDIMHFNLIPTGSLWTYITNSATGATTGSIKNLNEGNIGILTKTPEAKLDVNGTIKTPSLQTSMVCKSDGAGGVQDCFPTDFVWKSLDGSAGKGLNVVTPSGTKTFKNTCGDAKRAATGIVNGVIQCALVTPPPAASPVRCDSGYYVRGIRSDGCIYCNGGTSPKCP